MRYRVTAPARGFNGTVAGVRFSGGQAELDDRQDRAALAYCRRRGYAVEPLDAPEPTPAPERPAESDRKPQWVAYVAAVTDLSEAEAQDLTKAELIAIA